MAKRSESTNKIVEDLNKQIRDLKTRNHELTAELNKLHHGKQSSKESYEAACLLYVQISIRYAGQYESTNVALNYYFGGSVHRFGDIL